MLGYNELNSAMELFSSQVSFNAARNCRSSSVQRSLADIQQISTNLTTLTTASGSVNSATLVNYADSNKSSAVSSSSSQTSDAASFIVPLPVAHQQHTKASAAADSHKLPAQAANHCTVAAQSGQPVLDVGSYSSRPMLPNPTVPFKVTFSNLYTPQVTVIIITMNKMSN